MSCYDSAAQFRETHSISKRREETSRVLSKYPTTIPIFVSKSSSSDIGQIDKNKFLVPRDLTVGQFMAVLRKRLVLRPDQALFIFIGNSIPVMSGIMLQIYKQSRESTSDAHWDGFLYVEYAGENAFG